MSDNTTTDIHQVLTYSAAHLQEHHKQSEQLCLNQLYVHQNKILSGNTIKDIFQFFK